jgi:hypothetical protein
MSTYRAPAMRKQGWDYLITVKTDKKKLYWQAARAVLPALPGPPHDVMTESIRGCTTKWSCWTVSAESVNFPHIRQVACIIREAFNRAGEKTSKEVAIKTEITFSNSGQVRKPLSKWVMLLFTVAFVSSATTNGCISQRQSPSRNTFLGSTFCSSRHVVVFPAQPRVEFPRGIRTRRLQDLISPGEHPADERPGRLTLALPVPLPDLQHHLRRTFTQLIRVLPLGRHDPASSQFMASKIPGVAQNGRVTWHRSPTKGWQ